MSLSAKKVIKEYLDGMARKDETFAKAYANKSKNMDSCFNYIVKEALKKGTTACMTDDEVFGLAVHYYVEGELKDVKLPEDFQSVEMTETPKVKEAPKEKRRRKLPRRRSKTMLVWAICLTFDDETENEESEGGGGIAYEASTDKRPTEAMGNGKLL